MDVGMYRRIILNDLNNCQPLLVLSNVNNLNKIKNGHSFIQNDTHICIGWLILDIIYPVFQSTRHKQWLHVIHTGLTKEIHKRKKRRRLLIYTILLHIKRLPTVIIQAITEHI